jgi:hypothetical protein
LAALSFIHLIRLSPTRQRQAQQALNRLSSKIDSIAMIEQRAQDLLV